MSLIFPRVIKGNLGDLASRWSLLRAFYELNFMPECYIGSADADDIPPFKFVSPISLSNIYNLFSAGKDKKDNLEFKSVIWAVGLDLSDEFSLLKPLLLSISFLYFRNKKKKVICLFQGAGPIRTRLGKLLAKAAMANVDLFVARDSGTAKLMSSINPSLKIKQGFDAIFLPGLDKEILSDKESDSWIMESRQPIIGVNIRQWFHATPLKIPYQIWPRYSRQKSMTEMNRLIDSVAQTIQVLRARFDARILLISAYKPGIVPWEDDLFWLEKLKERFNRDDQVHIESTDVSIPEYFTLMANLDLSISMRLHSSLTALRFGVPTLNISYTLKGRDILTDMGLSDRFVELNDVLYDSKAISALATHILENHDQEKRRIQKAVSAVIEQNRQILEEVILEIN
jgi:polysaccharide pyruvyl transferase WcaK-like protein